MKIEIETQYDNPELTVVIRELVKFYSKMTLGKGEVKVEGKVAGSWDFE